MTIFFASSSSVGIPIARELLKEKLVDGFISNPDKPAGRNREIQPNLFAIWAETTNLKVHKPTNNLELKTIIENSELILTCSYGLLINADLLSIPKLGWLNVHFSLLPKYRGAAPVQRAIQNGDSETGYSVFRMEEGLDTWSEPALQLVPGLGRGHAGDGDPEPGLVGAERRFGLGVEHPGRAEPTGPRGVERALEAVDGLVGGAALDRSTGAGGEQCDPVPLLEGVGGGELPGGLPGARGRDGRGVVAAGDGTGVGALLGEIGRAHV